MIKFGDKKIKKIYFGDKKIGKVYFGDKLVWSSTKEYKFDINKLKVDGLLGEDELSFPLGRPVPTSWTGLYIDSNKEIQVKNLGRNFNSFSFGDEGRLLIYKDDANSGKMCMAYRSSTDKAFYFDGDFCRFLTKKDGIETVKKMLSVYIIENK